MALMLSPKEREMLVELAKLDGVSMADVIRSNLRVMYRKRFGNLLVCDGCGERSNKDIADSGWAIGDRGMLCPKCQG
jgi:hypothetical protein